jgi:uncharacterized repeat protein (TIGR01451 family)
MRRIALVTFLMFVGSFAPPAQAQNNTISTVAGGGVNPATATAAYIPGVFDAVRDSAGNTYISAPTLNVIYKVSSAGGMTIYAGTGIFGDGGDGGPATKAGLDLPEGLALDSSGNLFIADVNNNRIRRVDAQTQVMSTVAGSGLPFFPAYSGDHGPAAGAGLNFPRGVAVDANGNVFIADTGNQVVRMVDNTAQHIITTYAGNGKQGTTGAANGDGGAATSAQLSNPHAVALDSAGNLYIADTNDGVVRKVDNTAAHIITTYAGSPGTVNTNGGNGGPATQAGLSVPNGVFVDATGNLFIADTGNMAVRKVDTTSSHIITAVAGNNTGCFDPSTGCGNGGSALNAALNQPTSVSVDTAGNVIITDNGTQTVRIVSGGNISVFAGGASGGDGKAATSAILGLANVVDVDASGNLFILEQFGERVREVDATTQTINTIAGTGARGGQGFFGTTNTAPGPALKATLITPFAMTMDSAGNIYVADARGLVIRKISAASPRQISTIAGNGNFCQTAPCGDGGAAASAEFQEPSGLAVDSAGNLYISDASANVIRVLNQTTGVINTFAGSYTSASCAVYNSLGTACGDGGPALSAALNQPFALAFDSKGNLYLADSGDNAVRMITTAGIIGPYAFNGLPGFSGDGADALSASMTEAQQITFDPADNLYIGGGIDNVVRRVDGVDHSIITVAGDVENLVGGFSGDGGPSTQALIGNLGAAVDANHNLYIADGFQRVRKVHLVPVAAVDKALFTGAFGNVLAGQTSLSQEISITNNGLDDLLISNFTVPPSFAVGSTCSGLSGIPNSVAPGGVCIINIAFAPPAGIAGAIKGTVSMNTNDAANPILTFAVSGTVGAAPGDTLTVTVTPVLTSPQPIPVVSSDQLGISCPSTCSANFAAGEIVTLVAFAPAGSAFTGWSGSGCSGTGSCVVTMNGAQAVTATFGTPTISVTAIGNGSGTITTQPSSAIDCTYNGTATGGVCSAQLTGTNGLVTLTAQPNTGSTFAGWMGFCSFTTGTGPCVLPLQALGAFGDSGTQSTAVFSVTPQPFVKGQVFVGTAGGMIFVYNPTGTLAQVLNSGNTGGDIFGLTFDKNGNLYAANPVANNNNQADGSVEFFGNNGSGPTLFGTSTTFNTSPTSLVIDPNGNLFVSQTGGRQSLLEFPKASGTSTPSEFFPPVDTGGVDWIELLDDNQTMLYTSGTNEIKAFNVLDSIFVSDFATGLPGPAAFGMRELPDKTLLVANLDRLVRLSASGTVIQTYQPVKTGAFFVLNLDPNGADFWTGDNVAGVLYEVNIATGAIDKQFSTGLGFNSIFGAFGGINGLAVFGQPQSGGTDVSVTMTATPNPVAQNANLTYTIAVTNNGPLNATSVAATDSFPAGATFVSATTTQGSCSGTTTVSCNLGTLNSTASATITIVVAPTQGGALVNTVNVTSNIPDPNTLNNAATTSTTVNSTASATLRVALAGTAEGTVTDNLGQISCSQQGGANPTGTCSTQYPSGTQVILTESTPGTFAGWAGAPTACTVAGNTCTLTVSAAEMVTATFNPGPGTFPLTVSAGTPHTGAGTITSAPAGIACTLTGATASGTCASNFPAGTIVTLASAASGGSAFFGWSGSSPACLSSSSVSCVVGMAAAQSVEAEFTSGGATVTVAVTGAGNVKDTVNAAAINCSNTASGPQSGNCTSGYPLGTPITLAETPASGASFTGWGGTVCANPTATTCTFTVTTASTAYNVSATFGASGSGGGLSFTSATLPAGAVTVPYGADLQVSGGTPPYTFALAAGSTLPAGFTLNPTSVGNAAAGHVLNNAPDAAGTFTFGVHVTDSTTPTALTANATISLTIAAMPPNTQPRLLKGQYAMLLRGFNEVTGSEEAIIGSLKFDGTGKIAGVLDVNSIGTIGIANLAATGVYVIGPDNRGVMSITPAGQAPGIFTFSVGNVLNGVASTAYLTSFTDVTGTGDLYAGTLQQQDPTSFNNAAFAGTYVYDNTGQDPQGRRAAEIGLTTLNNANAITSGSADVNDDGATGSISTITGTYTTPDSNGRSLLSVILDTTPSSVVVYQISANEVVHMTLDARTTNVLLLGTAERQLNPNSFSNTSLAGPDVFSLVGSEGTQGTTGNIGLLTVTAGANPTVNVTLDKNDQGTLTIGQAVTGPLAITANGRGTMSPGGNSLIFYLTQPDQGFVMAADTPVEFGKIVPQVGAPFSATPFANNNLFLGQQEAAQGHSSQFSGIATLNAANGLTVTDDENHSGGNTFFDQALGNFTYTVSPTGHFTLTSSTQGNSSGYVVSPFEFVVLDTTGPASDPTPSIRPHVVVAQSIPAQAAPSTVTLTPTSLTFNPQTVGTTSAAQNVTLTNNGSAALTITGIIVIGTNPGDFAQTNTCPASLATAANCTISVTFTPAAAGARSGAISIADSAAGSPQAVPLSGTGTTVTAPAVTLAPSSLTFASKTLGTTSPSQGITLTNSGSAALTITGITVTGTNPGDFAQTNTCPASLGAGANCTISVAFTPVAAGARTAAVSIADNAGGSPQTVPLNGTGTGTLGPNPVPLLTQPLVPDAATPGGAAFTLTVNGTGFVSGATVNWNGSPRTTNLVSGSRLTAAITAADIAAAKTASISVTNPGAASSNVVFFTVRNSATSVSFANATGSPITVGTGPFAIAVGDFNGDGIQDLAVANDGAGSVTVLLGKGDGTFTAAAAPPGTFSGPGAILAADFNGDGKLDLAVLNGGNNTVTILLGNGNGTFSVPDVTTPTTGSNPLAFVAGDFNGDGKMDIAVANYRSNNLTILLGNGDGSFAATDAAPATGSFPAAIVAGDFNKDGKLDLAVDNQCGTGGACTAGTVTILLGDGTGNFTPAAASPATGSGPVSMALADFNGDGNLDLAVPSDCGSSGTCTSNGAVTILLGDGTGKFTAATSTAATGLRPYGIVVGDFNGDGKPDLAIANNDSNTVSILLGDGTGNFTPIASPPATGASPVFPAVGDFNNDGSLDLVVPNSGSDTISVFLAAGAPASPTITIAPTSLTFAAQALNTTSAAQTVTVSNSGTVPVTFTNITTTGDFAGANLTQCPSLAVDADPCTFQITFTPTANGTRTGTITFTDNATGNPQTVTLTGTGGTAAGTITLRPTSLTFAAQAVNTTSPAQSVTVANTGNVPVGLTGLGITGPFAIVSGEGSGTCTSETDLAVEASCTINLTFTPTAAGAAAGTLSVSDNATGSPQTVALSGTGGQSGVTITVPPGGSTTATTTPGGTAFYGLTITGAPGVTGTVQLGCIPSSNLITCQVIPSTITLTGGPTQIAFGIQTFCQGATSTGASLPFNFGGKFGWPIVILTFAGMLWTLQRNRRLALTFAMIMLMTLGSGACASLPKGPNGATPAGTYTLTLTTTLNGQTQTLQNFLTLVVK